MSGHADGVTRKYAILINGSSEREHLEAVNLVVPKLKASGDADEIYVLSPSPPSAGGYDYYQIATTTTLSEVIEGIRQKADADDRLLVYSFGHGWPGSIPCLEDNSCSYDFISEINSISYKQRDIILTGCYSGDARDEIISKPATLFASTGCPGETTYGGLYHQYFWSPSVPDLSRIPSNGPGKPSLLERCYYADDQFTKSVFGWEYASTPLCEMSVGYYAGLEEPSITLQSAIDSLRQEYTQVICEHSGKGYSCLALNPSAFTFNDSRIFVSSRNELYVARATTESITIEKRNASGGKIWYLNIFHPNLTELMLIYATHLKLSPEDTVKQIHFSVETNMTPAQWNEEKILMAEIGLFTYELTSVDSNNITLQQRIETQIRANPTDTRSYLEKWWDSLQ